MIYTFHLGDRVKFNRLGHLENSDPDWVYGEVVAVNYSNHVLRKYSVRWDDGFDDKGDTYEYFELEPGDDDATV